MIDFVVVMDWHHAGTINKLNTAIFTIFSVQCSSDTDAAAAGAAEAVANGVSEIARPGVPYFRFTTLHYGHLILQMAVYAL